MLECLKIWGRVVIIVNWVFQQIESSRIFFLKENLIRCASWLPLRNIIGRSRDPPTTFSCIQKSIRQHLKIEHSYAEKCLQDKATKKSWMNGWMNGLRRLLSRSKSRISERMSCKESEESANSFAKWLNLYLFQQKVNMTQLVSNKVQIFRGWSDIPKDKPQSFLFFWKSSLPFLRQGQKLPDFRK